ncbi:MAG: alpha-amylase family glycosyl hydrolase [Candidatus Marinimicrobia bacterium]|nr:alpha-amylase family glycosyl hydrolase [Candidatus Neomarinimicrobiota bacterium]
MPRILNDFLVLLMVLSNCEINQNVQSLSGKWSFKYDPEDIGETQGYFRTDFVRKDWISLNIPAFWDDPRYDGIGWYAVEFRVRKSLISGNRLALVFEAVDDDAVVYLNGEKIGEHTGPGVQFYFDLTQQVKPGESNLLVVRINDSGGAGGITGNVTLRRYEKPTELLQSEFSKEKAQTVPDWLKTACIYEVFVRAYSREGNFEALTKDLPRIKSLGMDCIWLMPIFPIGEKHRKGLMGSPYSIRDFKSVNPDLGTEQDLKNLVSNAHELGIKVILDIACNHSSWDNLLIEQHPDWYSQDAEGNIIAPNDDWSDVADFNYNSPGLREYMWETLEYWVTEFDIDGYRLDVAELVPDDFWKKALKGLQKIKSNLLMLAEGDHPRLYLNGFHLTYGWNTRRTFYQIIKNDYPADFLAQTLEKEYYRYPRKALKMRFTENHDEARTTALFSAEQTRVLTFLTFTLPGVPMVYAGQEVGAAEKPSLFEKSAVDWRQFDNGLSDLIRRMNSLRRKNSVLTSGTYQFIKTSHPESICAILRSENQERVLIIANLKGKSQTVSVDLSQVLPDIADKEPQLLVGTGAFLFEDRILLLPCFGYDYYLFRLETKND